MPRIAMEELAELEARIALKELEHKGDLAELRKEVAELKTKIGDLIEILGTFKGLARAAKGLENFSVFVAKVAAACGIVYAVWKFGVLEVVSSVKPTK